jgi:hypothetical protein
MANDNVPEELASLNSTFLSLKPRQIEKVFTDCVMDLKQILVLDGIDILPDGFRVHSHDLHGQLPEILMKNSGDTLQDKDRLGHEACKLIAIVKLRDEMVRFLPGCKLLPPTSMGMAKRLLASSEAENMDCKGRRLSRGISWASQAGRGLNRKLG